MPAALAFRYARALADLAGSARVDEVAAELDRFAQVLKESADLHTAMESPAVSPARKRAVVARMAEVLPLSDLTRRFLFVVIGHRRAALVSDIREAYEQVMDERLGVVRASVGSARPLVGAEREQVLASLARLTGKQVRARFEVREELVGGVLARIGSTVYDGSVKGQLEALKKRLAGTEK
jgi:F-type H+-transporting ATPase subunit delta